MFRRHMEPLLRADRSPVVTILGPRQSGKTTLARVAFDQHIYVSLEAPDERRLALDDPRGFLARFGSKGVILDEVQRAPELLSYVQGMVDERAEPARFVLTGSQNFLLMEKVSQTLAGRTSVLHLLPLSMTELFARAPLEPQALDRLDGESVPPPKAMWETVFSGMYPRVHDQGLDPTRWYGDYHRTYLERDLRDVLRVMDLDIFDRFVRAAAASTGQELVLASLGADVGVSLATAKSWLGALMTGFIVTSLPTHHRSYRKRLRKHPKLHFIDTGLVCYLLGIRSAAELASHPLRGAIFESFVVSEIRKAFTHVGRDAPLSYWRDASRREIDLLVDLGPRVLPLEVKSGLSVAPDAFDGLRYWSTIAGASGESTGSGVLVHGGDRALTHGELVIRPWYLA